MAALATMGSETIDALGQHVQLQQRLQDRRPAILEDAQMVEVQLESAAIPVPRSQHPSVHPLDGEYTRCPHESYETSCSVLLVLCLALVSARLIF